MLTRTLCPSRALSALETSDSSGGAVSRESDTGSEAVTASQLRNKTDCQAGGPAGVRRRAAATFGRLMSSLARQLEERKC